MLWFKHVKQNVKQKTLELRLPDNPTQEDLVVIENYLKSAKKKLRTGKKAYQNRIEIIPKQVIIYQPTNRAVSYTHLTLPTKRIV